MTDLNLLKNAFPKIDFNKRENISLNAFRRENNEQSYLIEKENIIAVIVRKSEALKSVSFPKLEALQYLNLSENKGLTALVFEEALSNLTYLDLSDNNLTQITFPKGFLQLDRIDLSRNELKRIHFDDVFPVLNMLDLSSNKIKNWDIDNLRYFPNLEYLYLWSNPLNESVTAYHSKEDGANNLRSLKELKTAFDKGDRIQNNEYKVLVVGDGKAGKTCFVTRLIENKFESEWDSTHGISVKQFTNAFDLFRFDYLLNLWDFGGQDLYHNTHRLFMQNNTIYVLLWNEETEYQDCIERMEGKKTVTWENRKLKYWLKYIAHIGGKSPVLVAQTISPPNNPKPKHAEERLFGDLYDFEEFEFLNIDSKLDDPKESGYRRFMRRMEDSIDVLDRNEWLPKHWVEIREALERMKPESETKTKNEFLERSDKTVDYNVYVEMAKKMGEDHPKKLLENWLVPTGVVFYKEKLFDNKIILNQEWAIKAIYTLYDREGFYHEIKELGGCFDGKLLNQIWSEYPQPEKELFLSFMRSCDMCFEITKNEEDRGKRFEERQFIAIEMLDDKRPPSFEKQENTWKKYKVDLIYFRYQHSFFYHGIIQSFIAKTYHFSKIFKIYRKGVLIETDGIDAIIEALENKQEWNGEVRITLPKSGIQTLFRIQKEFENIHIRDAEASVSLDGKVFVNLKRLKDKQNEPNADLVADDGKSIVKIKDYLCFLQKEEKTESLSEEIERIGEANRSLCTSDYLKEASNIIEVSMIEGARTFVEFKEIPEQIKILFLAATPMNQGQLNTGKESRFKDLFKYFDEEKRFKNRQEPGVSSKEFKQFLIYEDPHILHYGGHGKTEGILCDDKELKGETLSKILKLSKKTQCVILNACYSIAIAKKIAEHIPYVIGTQGPINDRTAIVFAQGFYMGIVAGRSIEQAFELGIIEVEDADLSDSDVLVLVKGTKSNLNR